MIHAVIHALNEWMHETWTVQLRGPHLRHAGDHAADRRARRSRSSSGWSSAAPRSCSSARRRCPATGARARSACPSSTRSGRRSSSTTSSSPCTRPTAATSATPTTGWAAAARCCRSSRRPSGCCRRGGRSRTRSPALVCHGALSRFPDLKVAVIENGSSWVEPLLEEPGRRLQEDAAGLPRGPGRGVQAQHLHQPVLGGGPRRAGRADRRGPRALRLGLPAPRGPGRPGELRRRARGPRPRSPSARSWAATSPA